MRPLRTMFAEFSWDTWPIVFGELTKRGVIEPVYWSGTASFAEQVKAEFPSCIYQDVMAASRGDDPLGQEPPVPRWTAAMLEVWKHDAQDILSVLTRADLEGAFDLNERLDYIGHQLAMWDRAIDTLKPDLAVFSAPPHVGYDYILLCLCRARRIPTLILEWCQYGPHMFYMQSIEEGDLEFAEKYRARLATLDGEPARVSERGQKYLEQLRGDKASAAHWPDMNKGVFGNNPYSEPGPIEVLKSEGEKLRRRVYEFMVSQYLLLDDSRRLLKKLPAVPWEGAFMVERDIPYRNAVAGPFVRSRLHRKYRRLLRTAYDRWRSIAENIKPVPKDHPLIFVALHQQPERTTAPQGGSFSDQMKIIQMLSAALPPGWKIAVKEHMSQLNREALGHMWRETSFYGKVAALPNVVLVAPRLPPTAMIDASKVVVTVSGTVGWEAVVRGKPAFVFGEAWYRDCEGVFRIRDFESCREALAKVAAGYQIDPRKVEAFLETVEKNQTEALPQPPISLCSLTLEENARRLVESLEKEFTRLVKGDPNG
jgi:hypothetical protein